MIIGHQKQLNFLRKSWEAKRASHAYLFVGPHGVGKRRVAAELAGWALGKDTPKDVSREFQICYVERAPDKKTGKRHKDISIEQVHSARDFLSHSSFLNTYKLVIIDEAEFLNRAAGNALLKTLEEPSPQSIIILLTDDEKKLLPTVVSRCQLVRFYPVGTGEIEDALMTLGASKTAAGEFARLCRHRPGAALDFLNESAELEFYNEETKKFFNLLGGSLRARFKELGKIFGKSDGDHIEKRDELVKILDIWQGLWRDLMLSASGAGELIKNTALGEKIKILSRRYGAGRSAGIVNEIEEAKKRLRQNIHPRLIFENLVLNF